VKYRSDIQGLRALAVLTVVAFHADRALLTGGFTGVDVFFVISGYLITRIVAQELDGKQFSLAGFYRRRVRRLFPALFAMLAFSLVAGAVLLPPANYVELARTTLATAFFVSNVEFARLSSYFGTAAELKPLLHTWSLAVEEQFYITFPLLLALMWRRARALVPAVVLGGAAVSFALAAGFGNTGWAFYMTPFRAFELMMGAALALRLVPPIGSKTARDVLSLVGLGLIVGGVTLIGKGSSLPVAIALLPCLGAVLVIHAGEEGPSAAGRLLSLRPVTFVGAISYSLYLWHWPFLVFARYYFLDEMTPLRTGLVLLAAFVMAVVSWRFIEQPFLKGRITVKRPLVVGMAAAGLFGVAALAMIGLGGLPGRFSPPVLALYASAEDYNHRRDTCQGWDKPVPYAQSCIYGAPNTQPSIAVWSDSQGVELVQAIGERVAKLGGAARQLSASACPPALGFTGSSRPYCAAHNRQVAEALSADPAVHTVFLVSFYSGYDDQAGANTGVARSAAALRQAGKRVVIVYPIPVMDSEPPVMLGMLAARGADPASYGTPLAAHRALNSTTTPFLDRTRQATGALALRPEAALCGPTFCPAYADGVGALYYNSRHLSLTGARHVTRSIPVDWLTPPSPVH
jgi:peptidoglycan/LPS O-acetylase OafA/YrhL